MRPIRLLLLILLIAAPSGAGRAEDRSCLRPAQGESARLQSVTERLDLFLVDGRQLFFPTLEAPRATPASPQRPREVADELASLFREQELTVQLLGQPDRWGRIPARIFGAGSDESADESLAAAGLAMATWETGACAARVRAMEASARAVKLGLWADADFAVLQAEQPQSFAARAGTLSLAEGRIRSVGRTAPRLYLNLGARFGGLTLTVARRNFATFERAGLTEKTLRDRLVRARGILEIGAGPQIELFHPWQLEVMDEAGARSINKPAAPAAADISDRN